MNILLAHFQIQDYGGIVNYSEYLARGFKELGHNVDSVMLKNSGKTGKKETSDRVFNDGWEYGPGLGCHMHQKLGWEEMFQLNYKSNIAEWYEFCEDFDIIIWVTPVPTCTKKNKGDTEWLDLYNDDCILATQLAVVHDGNLQKLYPHMLHICQYLSGVICVHDVAFNSAEVLPVRRTLIPNPHDITGHEDVRHITVREDGFLSLQTFKRWKRVDDLVRAIPYCPKEWEKLIAGGGIEYCYMTSKTKVKPEYLDDDGFPIWDNAVENGMEFLGYINTEKRDEILSQVKLLIDPSWSKKYSELGCHFNRVMIEAIVKGCIPVCTDLAMKNSLFFKPNVNYLEIPYDCSPGEYSGYLRAWMRQDELLQNIQDNNMKLVKAFDKVFIADAIMEFSQGGRQHIVGKPTEKFHNDCMKKLEFFEDL